MPRLEIRNLCVEFATARGRFRAVDGLDLDVEEGEILGIVGESGSGKSVAMLAVMGLVAAPGRVSADVMRFGETDLLRLAPAERRWLCGRDIAMVFQDPAAALNPCFPIGWQIGEALSAHLGLGRRERRARVIELLGQVGIAAPESRLGAYPHQLSGGMNQRVMIAMAIACGPRLVIADEPTTALDVTIQRQILDLLVGLQQARGMALVLISHDLGVIAETADRVQVMYAGQAAETAPAADLVAAPRHPYTAALLAALPERAGEGRRLPSIPGTVPGIADRPAGCLFHPRCGFATGRCSAVVPALDGPPGHPARCHYPLDPAGQPTGREAVSCP